MTTDHPIEIWNLLVLASYISTRCQDQEIPNFNWMVRGHVKRSYETWTSTGFSLFAYLLHVEKTEISLRFTSQIGNKVE